MNFDNYINHLFPKPVVHEKREGKQGTKKQVNTTKVVCTNDNKVFDSMGDAAKHYNLNVGNISRVVRGSRNHINGLVFRLV